MDIFISVIIPCYNQAKYLVAALDSVLNQSYTNWESIIVNDGSVDETENIAHSYTDKDSRFKYISKKNGGLSSARNAGLKIAKGDFIQFLDADDFISNEKFSTDISMIKSDPACCLIISNFKIYNHNTKQYTDAYCDISVPITLETIIKNWDVTFTIPIHCGFIKRNIINEFNEDLRAKEDWVQWINIFSRITHYHFNNEPLAFYRHHENNMFSQYDFMDKNTLLAYPYIYGILKSRELKDIIFFRFNEYATRLLEQDKHLLMATKNSHSYKLGNLLLKPFSYLKQLLSK